MQLLCFLFIGPCKVGFPIRIPLRKFAQNCTLNVRNCTELRVVYRARNCAQVKTLMQSHSLSLKVVFWFHCFLVLTVQHLTFSLNFQVKIDGFDPEKFRVANSTSNPSSQQRQDKHSLLLIQTPSNM